MADLAPDAFEDLRARGDGWPDAQPVVSDADGTLGGDGTTCGANSYPCGPYGFAQGEVIAPITLPGFKDPQDACKAHQAKVVDLQQETSLSVADWYGGGCTPAKKVLWMRVCVGWAGPCVTETRDVKAEVDAGVIDPRVALLEVLVEDDKHAPADSDFLRLWATKLGVNWPLARDPKLQTAPFMGLGSVPVTVLVDLSTMTIAYKQSGSNLAAVGQQVQTLLSSTP